MLVPVTLAPCFLFFPAVASIIDSLFSGLHGACHSRVCCPALPLLASWLPRYYLAIPLFSSFPQHPSCSLYLFYSNPIK